MANPNTLYAVDANPLFARVFGGFAIRRILYFLFSDCKSLYSLCGGLHELLNDSEKNRRTTEATDLLTFLFPSHAFCSPGCSVDYNSPMRSADFQIRRMLYTRSSRIANPNTHYAADCKSTEHTRQRGLGNPPNTRSNGGFQFTHVFSGFLNTQRNGNKSTEHMAQRVFIVLAILIEKLAINNKDFIPDSNM